MLCKLCFRHCKFLLLKHSQLNGMALKENCTCTCLIPILFFCWIGKCVAAGHLRLKCFSSHKPRSFLCMLQRSIPRKRRNNVLSCFGGKSKITPHDCLNYFVAYKSILFFDWLGHFPLSFSDQGPWHFPLKVVHLLVLVLKIIAHFAGWVFLMPVKIFS